MFWRRKTSPGEDCGRVLYAALAQALTQNGRIRAEDLISATAAIAGETIIGAAQDFNPRDHEYAPGSRILSTRANELFCGDTDLHQVPDGSVLGILLRRLKQGGFADGDFPDLKAVFTCFVSNIGKAEDWGKVPLSVPKENHPFIIPLRVAYETRPMVDKIFAPLREDQNQRLQAASISLAETLCKTRDALDRRIAITLALETVNGMAKTAPMTDVAMAKMKAKQSASA